MPAVERRDPTIDPNATSIKNPVYIAGVCIIGVIILAVTGWLARRFYIRRHAAKDVWFLSVKGLVPEDGESIQEKALIPSLTVTGAFSRKDLDSTIPLPDKILSRSRLTPATRDEIIDYHRQSGSFPQSFSPKPFSFALSANGFDTKRDSKIRLSVGSASGLSLNRFSVMSAASSSPSVQSATGAVRKVRQLFEPVLPDELLLTKVGEQLTIVQSFDDGWCVVGRENGLMVHTAKSLFKSSPQPEGDIELGVVPAWCFIKPMQGVRVERPVRSTSLGVTVNVDGPALRNDLVSWSNF